MNFSAMNLVSLVSSRLVKYNRVFVALLGVLVLSSCAGAVMGVGAVWIGSKAIPLEDAKVSSYDFGKGQITSYRQGCTHRGTWTNHSDKIQRSVRVDLQALDESGSTIGVSQLTFNATLPGETSYSKEQNIAWKQIDSVLYHHSTTRTASPWPRSTSACCTCCIA